MPPATTQRSQRASYILYYFLSLFILALVVVWSTALFGHVTGTEFSPESFQRRRFSFYQLPLLGIQITANDRNRQTNPTEHYLLKKKIITPTKPEQWDLVVGHVGGARFDPKGASILCSYLDAVDHQQRPYWENWSRNHPKLAAILWPEVAAMARMRHYELIPDLMQLAKTADESQAHEFQEHVEALAIHNALKLAKWLDSSNKKRATSLYEWVLSKDPDNSQARVALGKPKE